MLTFVSVLLTASLATLTREDFAISPMNLLLPCAPHVESSGAPRDGGAASHVIRIDAAEASSAAAVKETCFDWERTGSMAQLEPIDSAGEPLAVHRSGRRAAESCGRAVRVEAGSAERRGSCPQRTGTSISVIATQVEGGAKLTCEVQLAPVARLSFSTSWRRLHMNQTERVKIRAFDAKNNTFNSLHGLRFEWSVEPKGLLEILQISSSSTRTSRAIRMLEARDANARGSEVILRGLKTGVVNLTARIVEAGYEAVESTTIEIDVIEKLDIIPRPIQWVLPLTKLQYALHVNEELLPPPFSPSRFAFTSSDPAIATVVSSDATTRALRRGVAHIAVSTALPPNNTKAVELNVVYPTSVRICWQLRREPRHDCATAVPPPYLCANSAEDAETPIFLVAGRTYDVHVSVMNKAQRVRTKEIAVVLELHGGGDDDAPAKAHRVPKCVATEDAVRQALAYEYACFEQVVPTELGMQSLKLQLPLADDVPVAVLKKAETNFTREWVFPAVHVVDPLHLVAHSAAPGLQFARRLPLQLLHGYPFALRASGGSGEVEWRLDPSSAASRGVVLHRGSVATLATRAEDGLVRGSVATLTTRVEGGLVRDARIEVRDRRSGQLIFAKIGSDVASSLELGLFSLPLGRPSINVCRETLDPLPVVMEEGEYRSVVVRVRSRAGATFDADRMEEPQWSIDKEPLLRMLPGHVDSMNASMLRGTSHSVAVAASAVDAAVGEHAVAKVQIAYSAHISGRSLTRSLDIHIFNKLRVGFSPHGVLRVAEQPRLGLPRERGEVDDTALLVPHATAELRVEGGPFFGLDGDAIEITLIGADEVAAARSGACSLGGTDAVCVNKSPSGGWGRYNVRCDRLHSGSHTINIVVSSRMHNTERVARVAVRCALPVSMMLGFDGEASLQPSPLPLETSAERRDLVWPLAWPSEGAQQNPQLALLAFDAGGRLFNNFTGPATTIDWGASSSQTFGPWSACGEARDDCHTIKLPNGLSHHLKRRVDGGVKGVARDFTPFDGTQLNTTAVIRLSATAAENDVTKFKTVLESRGNLRAALAVRLLLSLYTRGAKEGWSTTPHEVLDTAIMPRSAAVKMVCAGGVSSKCALRVRGAAGCTLGSGSDSSSLGGDRMLAIDEARFDELVVAQRQCGISGDELDLALHDDAVLLAARASSASKVATIGAVSRMHRANLRGVLGFPTHVHLEAPFQLAVGGDERVRALASINGAPELSPRRVYFSVSQLAAMNLVLESNDSVVLGHSHGAISGVDLAADVSVFAKVQGRAVGLAALESVYSRMEPALAARSPPAVIFVTMPLLCGELPVGAVLPSSVAGTLAASRFAHIALVPGASRTLRCIGGHPDENGTKSPLCGGGSDLVWQPLRYEMEDKFHAGGVKHCSSAKIVSAESGCTVDTAAPVVVRGAQKGTSSLVARVKGENSTSIFLVTVDVVRLKDVRILTGSLTSGATSLLVNSSRKLTVVGIAEDGRELDTMALHGAPLEFGFAIQSDGGSMCDAKLASTTSGHDSWTSMKMQSSPGVWLIAGDPGTGPCSVTISATIRVRAGYCYAAGGETTRCDAVSAFASSIDGARGLSGEVTLDVIPRLELASESPMLLPPHSSATIRVVGQDSFDLVYTTHNERNANGVTADIISVTAGGVVLAQPLEDAAGGTAIVAVRDTRSHQVVLAEFYVRRIAQLSLVPMVAAANSTTGDGSSMLRVTVASEGELFEARLFDDLGREFSGGVDAMGVDVPRPLLCSSSNATSSERTRTDQVLEVVISDPTALRACIHDDGEGKPETSARGALQLKIQACHATREPVEVEVTLTERNRAGQNEAVLSKPADTARVEIIHGVEPRAAVVAVGGSVVIRRLGRDGGCDASPTWTPSPANALSEIKCDESHRVRSAWNASTANGVRCFRAKLPGRAKISFSFGCAGYSGTELIEVHVVKIAKVSLGSLYHLLGDGDVDLDAPVPFLSNAPGLLRYVSPIRFHYSNTANGGAFEMLHFTKSVEAFRAQADGGVSCSLKPHGDFANATTIYATGALAGHFGEGAPLCRVDVKAAMSSNESMFWPAPDLLLEVAVVSDYEDDDLDVDEDAIVVVKVQDERLRLSMGGCPLNTPPPEFKLCELANLTSPTLRHPNVGDRRYTLDNTVRRGELHVLGLLASGSTALEPCVDDDVRHEFVGSVIRIGADEAIVTWASCASQDEGGRKRVEVRAHAPFASDHATGEVVWVALWRAEDDDAGCAQLETTRPLFVRVRSAFTRRKRTGEEHPADAIIFAGLHANVTFSTSPALTLKMIDVGDEMALQVQIDGAAAAAAAAAAGATSASPTRAYLVALFNRLENASSGAVSAGLGAHVQRHRLCFELPPRDERASMATRVAGGWWSELVALLKTLPSALGKGGNTELRNLLLGKLLQLLVVPAIILGGLVIVAVYVCSDADRRERERAERRARGRANIAAPANPFPTHAGHAGAARGFTF